MKKFSCQEEFYNSVSGHHSVQQPLIPHCFSGNKFVSKAKPQEQLCLLIPSKHTLSTFTEEREAYINDEIPSGLNMANKNLVNKKELENVQLNTDFYN